MLRDFFNLKMKLKFQIEMKMKLQDIRNQNEIPLFKMK